MALHLKLFSQLEVMDAAKSFAHQLTPRARRLLAYLLLHRANPLTREQIAFALWIDSSEKEALGTLRRALHDLRNTLTAAGPDEWVLGDRIGLRWNSDAPYCQRAHGGSRPAWGTSITARPVGQTLNTLWHQQPRLGGQHFG